MDKEKNQRQNVLFLHGEFLGHRCLLYCCWCDPRVFAELVGLIEQRQNLLGSPKGYFWAFLDSFYVVSSLTLSSCQSVVDIVSVFMTTPTWFELVNFSESVLVTLMTIFPAERFFSVGVVWDDMMCICFSFFSWLLLGVIFFPYCLVLCNCINCFCFCLGCFCFQSIFFF